MTPGDDAELTRLSDMLSEIDAKLPTDSPLLEALKKAALALSDVFIAGNRSELESSYDALGGELSEQEKNDLRSIGIDPDAEDDEYE